MMTRVILKTMVCTLVLLVAVAVQPASCATKIDADTTEETILIPQFENIDMDIDGRLNEAIWSELPGYDDMKVIQPDTLKEPRYRTVAKFFYTNQGLYVGIYNFQPKETLIERLSKRDQSINRDGIEVTLDPTGEGLYGYWFGVNLGGSLADGTVLPERIFSREWDGPWRGNAYKTDDGWTAEMFLPWSMMAMPKSTDQRFMSIFVSRKVAHLDETWSWPALPETGSTFMSALQPILMQKVDPRRQFSVYPYTSALYDQIYSEIDYRIGADIFWRPSTNLQLTLGINPDFGTVESDDVVINLTAFESFFPEKRLFFLEGHEVFITSPRSAVSERRTDTGARKTAVNFHSEPTTLVNTRRIGGPARPPVIPPGASVPGIELRKPSELYGAAKITGQKSAFRYGLMAAMEKDTIFKGKDANGNPIQLHQDGRDFGVLRFLYEKPGTDRRSLGWISTLVSHPEEDAIVHGIDWHYLSARGKLKIDGQAMTSDVGDTQGYGGFSDFVYMPKIGTFHTFRFDYFDDKLDVSDLGFIRRNDAINFWYIYRYSTSSLKRLRTQSTQLIISQEYNTDWRAVRSGIFTYTYWTFHNLSQFRTELDYFPPRWDDRNSRGNGPYRIPQRWVAEISYGTDTSRMLSISAALGRQQEDSGEWRTNIKGGLTFRPSDRFSLDLDVNHWQSDGWLVYQGGRYLATFKATSWQPGLSMGVFFTARQQLNLSMQWAGIRAFERSFYKVPEEPGRLIQVNKPEGYPTGDFTISRLIAQVRYRWEIAPLSDLFIVYTRGSNLPPNRIDDGFSDLFYDALNDPIIDYFIIKLRYRFGN